MPQYREWPSQWSTWIRASINKYCVEYMEDVHTHLEGTTRDTDGKSEWIEVRVTDIRTKEQTRGSFTLYCSVNIAVCVIQTTQMYQIDVLIGKVVAMLSSGILVRRLGPEDDPTNDGSFVGCLDLIPNTDLQSHVFGNIKNSKMIQGAVEGDYQMNLRSAVDV